MDVQTQHIYPIPYRTDIKVACTNVNIKLCYSMLFWGLQTQLGKKVKCTLVQALKLCTGRTAQKGSRGIALLFLDRGTRRG